MGSKSIITRETLSRRPLAGLNCLLNPQNHICGLLQDLPNATFQGLTAIVQTSSHNELCGGLGRVVCSIATRLGGVEVEVWGLLIG